MKIFREIIIVFGLYVVGDIVSTALSLPLPGSLIGMMLLFLLLYLHVLQLEQIQIVSEFLLTHLSFFFIPAGVALMASFASIQSLWFPILLICVVTTLLTMGCCGWSIQKLLERKKN